MDLHTHEHRWLWKCRFIKIKYNEKFSSSATLQARNRYMWLLLLLLLSHFSRVRLCATPSLGFSRQEHWSGLPFPSPTRESEK